MVAASCSSARGRRNLADAPATLRNSPCPRDPLRGSRFAAKRHDNHPLEFRLRAELLIEGQQNIVHQRTRRRRRRAWVRMAAISSDVARASRWSRPAAGTPKYPLPDAPSGTTSGVATWVGRAEGSASGPARVPAAARAVEIGVGSARQGTVGPPRDDLDLAEDFSRALEQGRECQRIVHHQAAQWATHGSSAIPLNETRSGRINRCDGTPARTSGAKAPVCLHW